MEATNEGFSCEEKSDIPSEKLKKDEAPVAREQKITKLKLCTFFFNYNYCKFINNCKYEHVKRESKNERTPMQYNMRKSKQNANKNESHNLDKPTTSKQNCRYYYKIGTCRNGDNCEFIHSDELIINEISALSISSQSQNCTKKYFSNNGPSKTKTSMPLCYYFKRGQCHRGDSCKFYHQNKSSSYCDKMKNPNKSPVSNAESIMPVTKSSTREKTIPFTNKNLNACDLTSFTSDDISELRSTEINQLKKRFPRFGVITENKVFSIIFQPSDPDWAFDLNKLHLEVDFPVNYPKEECKITVVQNAENIPFLFIKYLNNAIFEWIHEKFKQNNALNKIELIFRPFLKWFDKNLEDLFVTGLRKVKQDLKAKADGIEFVAVETLFSSTTKSEDETSIVDSPELQENHSSANNFSDLEELDASLANPSELHKQNSAAVNKTSGLNQNNKPFYASSNNATKIIFTNLEFIEGTAAFMCSKVSATLQCCRCKTSFNMKTVPKKNNSHVCTKCSKNVGFTFEPSTVHQFSSVLGNFHLLECVAVDINLVECHFLIDCLNCSKQVPVDGIHYGQKHKMWCLFCNQKMLITIGSVKFQTLNLMSAAAIKLPSAKKIEKKSKDPLIKEGEPLPNFGACKHYKKSFRWLRFPCCGRLYPCDECHNEKETDHEMKYASRMICGFCSKEQPYSRDKPCFLCSQNMTKKSGSHWEGGKGCRNRITMCREDKQKYSGTNKTISKKAQSTKPKKKH